MRKFTMLMLCVFLSGCQRIPLPESPPYTTAQAAPALWQPISFADTAECGFRVERCEVAPEGGCVCELVCHNRSHAPQLFSCEAWCVDGWQVLSFWGQEIAPGAEERFSVAIPAPKPEENSAWQPGNIAFDLRIFSQADLRQNYLVSAHCNFSPAGAKGGLFLPEPLSWPENGKVLADNNGCVVVLTAVRQTPEHYEVDCLMENKTRSNMVFRLYDPVFNGVEQEQVYTLQLSPGAKCAQTITFDLPATAGHVRWLELEMQIFNCDQWFGKVWVEEGFCIRVSDL